MLRMKQELSHPHKRRRDMETKKIWQVLLAITPVVGLVACSSDSSTSDTVAVVTTVASTESTMSDGSVTIDVVVGENSGPDRVEEVALGSQVTLTFTNPDADDEFHVHGYDLGGDMTKKGDTKTFTFTADKAGEYEVESHLTEAVLMVLRVS
jgi:plastocyanin